MGLLKKVKKVASVAVHVATGGIAAGGVGSVYGLARGLKENTKTSKAGTINLRKIGQTAVGASVANIAAGVVAGGAHAAFGALPVGAGPGGIPLANAGGPSFFSKFGTYVKAGGLTDTLKKGIPNALSFLGKQGTAVANAAGETFSNPDGVVNTIDKVKSGLNRNKSGITKAVAAVDKATGKNYSNNRVLQPLLNGTQSAPPVIINGPGEGGGSQTPLLLAGAGMLALFFLRKK